MDIYQLNYLLHEPAEDHGWMYRAEVPALQGCVAWGAARKKPLKAFWQWHRPSSGFARKTGNAFPPT